MARGTSTINYPSRTRISHPNRKQEPQGDLAGLINDTIRMIEDTRSFLERLDRSQTASRKTMARSCQRLEEALAALKHRQQSLAGREHS